MEKKKKKPATIKIPLPKFNVINLSKVMIISIVTFIILMIGGIAITSGDSNVGKGLASIGVCGLGAVSMQITKGETGIGWAIFGLLLIW